MPTGSQPVSVAPHRAPRASSERCGYRDAPMRLPIATTTVLLLATASLAACGAKTSLVTLRVTDDAGAPLRAARVRAAPLETNGLPLPVSLKTLGQAMAKTSLNATTDADGEVHLKLLESCTHYVQVVPPMSGTLADLAVADSLDWHWFLDLEPVGVSSPPNAPNPPGVRLEVVP